MTDETPERLRQRDRLAALLHEVGLRDDSCIHRPPFYACHRPAIHLLELGVRVEDEGLREALADAAERILRLPIEPGRDEASWLAAIHAASYAAIEVTER